jgi:hypothetical protein
MTNLRTLLWFYLVLLIFEGALRKWIVPALDTPLLIVRDPLVIWIYVQAIRNRLSFNNAFFAPNLFLAALTAVLATIFGDGNAFVTIYGLRTDFLQIPLIFLIPQILDRDDVIAMGRFILLVSIPMAALAILQFRSPVDSLVNKGAFATHYATVRPSGTFSFIPGLVAYFSFTASFLFFGFIQARTYKLWLLVVVTFSLLIASACSGSRSCLLAIGIVAVIAILCVVIRGKGGTGIFVAAALIALLIPVLSTFEVFQKGAAQLTERFADTAAQGEDAQGMLAREANSMVGPFSDLEDLPFFGHGLGIGTNAAAGMLLGQRAFIGPEDEWGRLFFECGSVCGLMLCIFRIALTLAIAKSAYDALRRDNLLPILLFAACGLLILNGQWGVPTTLGFAIFGGGLTLAACVEPPEDEEEDDHDENHDHAEGESDHAAAADSIG